MKGESGAIGIPGSNFPDVNDISDFLQSHKYFRAFVSLSEVVSVVI